MAEWCTVTGKFMSQQKQGGDPRPLSGRVVFQARTHARGDATLYGASPRVGYVVDGVLCEDPEGTSPGVRLLAPSEGVQPSSWSVRVSPALRDDHGAPVSWRGFDVVLVPGGTVDLVDAAPVPDPVTGVWVTRGEQGEQGKAPTLTWDGTKLLIDGEPGPDLAAPARQGVTAEQFLSQETFTIAHRGSGDVFPEHTLEAYRGSVAQGAEAVEVSVRVTADGVPVCIHDDELYRTTGIDGSVAELTLAELQTIRVTMIRYLGSGSPVTRVPTLDEALQVLAGRAVVFLEPKVPAAVAPVLEAVKEWGISSSTVFKTYRNGAGGYTDSPVLQRVKAAGMTTWCYVDAGDALGDIETLAGHADMIGVPFFGDVDKDAPSSMPREKIKQVVAFGKPVIAWEVHRLADRAMLAGLGVRGFMSPQWALLAGNLTPRRATRFSSRQRVAGEQIGPDNTEDWAPYWDGVDLVMDQTWDASYCLGAFATAPTYTLRASWAWTFNTPTAGGTHAGIVFGASNDEAWGFGPKHKTSTSGSYLLIRRGDGRISLLKYAPGATGGVALGELKGPKPADGVPLKVAVEVTPEQLRVTATGVDGEIVSQDTDYRGPFIHLARNHGMSSGGPVAYGDVVVAS